MGTLKKKKIKKNMNLTKNDVLEDTGEVYYSSRLFKIEQLCLVKLHETTTLTLTLQDQKQI